jgi:1,4-alpha-glucan branching enzyme
MKMQPETAAAGDVITRPEPLWVQKQTAPWKGLMKSLGRETSSAAYLPLHSLILTNFYCHAPQAKSVELAGDFNHWTPVAMCQRVDGWWYLQALLAPGHHPYRFLVDGRPTLDPQATGVGRDESNEAVSIIAVS